MTIVLSQCSESPSSIQPPLGIGYLASVLRKAGHDVAIFGPRYAAARADAFAKAVMKHRPDVVGLSFLTPALPKVRQWTHALRKMLPNVPVVLGGPHATALPQHTLQFTDADFVVVGEGEIVLRELVNDLGKGVVESRPGLVQRDKTSDGFKRAPLLENLDSLPMPAWDLIRPERYPPTPHAMFYRRFPVAPMITTRGCPYDCSFCASGVTWNRRLRFRSAVSVVDEIEYLMRNHGIREIHFEDDNLTATVAHASTICEEILRRGMNLAWSCPDGVRIDRLNRELLKLMHRAGCYMIGLGIETANQDICDQAGKKLNLSCVEEKVNLIREAGIDAFGFFILGLPGETHQTAKETMDLACRLPFSYAHFAHLIPLPGTRIFHEWLGARDLNHIPWERFDTHVKTLWRTEALNADEIIGLRHKAWRRFYLRPRSFLKMALMIKPRQIPHVLRRILAGRV